jgi:CubicO group peptidase (beta-lactamase class C family)
MRFTPLLAVLLAAPPVRAAEPDVAAVDKLVADAMQAWDAPGAALVVVRGDRIIHLKGYGRRQHDKPDAITPDTLFPIASCTKAFTATLLAMLADDGKLDWDDRASKHLPGFKLADAEASEKVTLRDLLAHRTGVPGHDLLWYGTRLTVDDVLAKVDILQPTYPFRGGFEYNSIMYMAAGRAAERITKQPWDALVKDRITGPLGMAGIRFTTKNLPADHAIGQVKGAKLATMPMFEMPEPNPAGSIHASARDLGAWLKFQLSGGVVGGKRLVSEKNLLETRTPQNTVKLVGLARAMNPDTEKLQYGLGWVVLDHRGKRVCTHGGQIDGFRTQITLLPDEKLGFAILNNLHETRMNQALTNTLIDAYCGLSERDWNAFFLKIVAEVERGKQDALAARNAARKPEAKPSLPLASYAGTYRHPVFGDAKVTVADDKPVFAWGRFTAPMEHFESDSFRIMDGYFAEKLLEFTIAAGKPTAMRFHGSLFERVP